MQNGSFFHTISPYSQWDKCFFNPFNPKLTMQILPTIQEENDWEM